MSSFLKRSLSGLIYAILFVSTMVYSKETYVLLTSLFGFFCLWELQKLTNYKSYIPYLLLIAAISYIVFLPRIALLNDVLLVLVLSSSLQHIIFLYSKRKYPQTKLEKFDVSFRYLILSFGFLMMLPMIESAYEYMIILPLVLFIWANDSFAYLIGKNFGKRKLFQSVSPKKTIEGFIGGIFFTIVTAIIIANYSDLFSMTHWIVLSIITSVLGTTGDLVESKLKRQAKVKDSGYIMPGHGGLLDRLDSLLFVAPFVYLYIHYLI